MQNPSIVLYGAKTAKLEDKHIPELTDPHDVLVRIAYVGVCGSDVSFLTTPYPSLHPLAMPTTRQTTQTS
jgi:threonine dehydrogenase-like Zn-dependent dehydrogenase